MKRRQGLGRSAPVWQKAGMRSTYRADVPAERVASAPPTPRAGGRGRRWLLLLVTALAPLAALAVPGEGTAEPALETRYPYDPACPWGRLANGRGMITRCIGEEEARALLAGGTLTLQSGAAIQIPPTTSARDAIAGTSPTTATSPAPAAPESGPAAPAGTEPTAGATDEKAATDDSGGKPETAPATPPPEAPPAKPVRVEVGPILPEDGDVSIGKLDKPIDRYRACVEQNGGLQGATGEVRVHFLVRGERSRAEGVEVTQFRGVTKQAAQCIADVVDRRPTGTPSQPIVGATLVFKLSS